MWPYYSTGYTKHEIDFVSKNEEFEIRFNGFLISTVKTACEAGEVVALLRKAAKSGKWVWTPYVGPMW